MSEQYEQNLYNKPEYCRKCHGEMVFVGLGEYKCDKCGFLDYDDYGIVRNYLEIHKNATAGEVSVMTGVSQSTINQMLRNERFNVAENSKVYLKCVGCGADIITGKYCNTCAMLAKATELKKKKSEEAQKHKELMSGVGLSHTAESGAKRFNRK